MGLNRKDFIKNTSAAIGLGAISNIWPLESLAKANFSDTTAKLSVIKNVKLETGFDRDDLEVTGTRTKLFTLVLDGNKIKEIKENDPNANAIDAKGYLLMPAMRDMHIHLDKTFYGEKWQAKSKRYRTVKDMIALEQKTMPDLLKKSTFKAEKIIELLQSKGSNFARSHVNIEPTSKLQSLINLQKAIENKSKSFGVELVAFPQHGLFSSNSVELMKDAAQMDIDFIGGLDPNAIDGTVEKTIDFTVDLALSQHKGIDIHLHEGGKPGLRTVEYLIEKVKENPALQGKTYLSHCFVLAELDPSALAKTCEDLAAAKIGIVSTVPFGKTVMPLPTLYKHGIKIMTGTDSVVDHWNTFGTGSMLIKANLMAQLYGLNTEFDLSRCLAIATNDVLPLNSAGEQAWPKPGDPADFIFVDSSCTAEAVARVPEIKALLHQGDWVFNKI